jgi:putative Holliday junction resolvase
MTSQHPALGIDYGEARIGIAATDPVGIMAHPVETIHRHKTDGVTRIVQLVQERGIRTLVLGIPVRMDGTEGTAAAKVRAFGRELAAALPGLPMVFMDECLTTVIAQEKLHAAGKKEKSFRPIIDQVAAVEILNTWLETANGAVPRRNPCFTRLRNSALPSSSAGPFRRQAETPSATGPGAFPATR